VFVCVHACVFPLNIYLTFLLIHINVILTSETFKCLFSDSSCLATKILHVYMLHDQPR
jgi:hypothetical protein